MISFNSFRTLRKYAGVPRFIATLLLGFFMTLCLLIALNSQFNAHPDEEAHMLSANYYENNWFKQRVDHESMLKTLIPGWGISYLHLNDVVYFLTPTVTKPLSLLTADKHLQYRMFNVILLATLILIFRPSTWVRFCFLASLCLTPQAWYIFSYINGDGISLAYSYILCLYFTVNRHEITGYFFQEDRKSGKAFVFMSLSAGIIFIRMHYWLILPFLICCIVVNGLEFNRPTLVKATRRLLIFFAFILLVYALNWFFLELANDFRRLELITEIRNSYAIPGLSKQSILTTGNNPHLMYSRELGVKLTHLIFGYAWFPSSYNSFIGVYGYMNLLSSQHYYALWPLVVAAPPLLYLVLNCLRATIRGRLLVTMTAIFFCMTICQSIAYSWLYGFQPQGRYLFAVLPMLATVLGMFKRRVSWTVAYTWLCIALAFNSTAFLLYAVLPLTR